MNLRLKFVSLIVLSIVLLLTVTYKTSIAAESDFQASLKITITLAPKPKEQKLEVSDYVVYTLVLNDIIYGRNLPDRCEQDVFESFKGDEWLILRKETVAPENLDEIKSLTNLSEDLINDFIEKNKSKAELRNRYYEAPLRHNVIFQDSSLESFFILQKNKQPDLKAIIGFSKIGFNSNQTQLLVYVEYYSPEIKLQKKYCLITLKPEGNSIREEIIKWF